MNWSECKPGLERLGARIGKAISEEEAGELWPNLQRLTADEWTTVVDHLVKTRLRPPDNWIALIMTTIKEVLPSRSGHGAKSYVGPRVESTREEDAAGPMFFSAVLYGGYLGRQACEEFSLVAKEMEATLRGAECPCIRGLVLYFEFRDPKGVGTGEFLAGPCPNGCGRAARIVEKCREAHGVPIVRGSDKRFMRWLRFAAPERRLQVLDDDRDAERVWR